MSSSNGQPLLQSGSAARPLIIEFIGTPGSGKTTLSKVLVALLREQGIQAATVLDAAREHARRTLLGRPIERIAPASLRGPLLWWVFYLLGTIHAVAFTRDHAALAQHVLRAQLGRPIGIATKRHILFWLFQLWGRYRFLTATPISGEALVLDDGLLHRCVHLAASHVEEPDAETVAAYVDLLPRADLVINTIAGREVCERRVRDRGVWAHSRRLSAAELSHYLGNAERVSHLAVRRARELGWPVVEIATEGREMNRVMCDLRMAIEPLLGVGPALERSQIRVLK
jgi:energy-coupling factor transporter ATP-binding protein EcfA2